MPRRRIDTWRIIERRHRSLVSINATAADAAAAAGDDDDDDDDGSDDDGLGCRIASFSTWHRHQNEARVIYALVRAGA